MDEGETNKQLLELVEQLKRENELLKAKIRELEARLAQYENAHTPPSLRRGRNRKKDGDNRGNPGQKTGHKGVTRPYAKSLTQNKIDNFILQKVVYILWRAKWTLDHS